MIVKEPITTKRYFFEKGWKQVKLGDREVIRQQIMHVLNIRHESYFSTLLNKGILEISMTRHENITNIFAHYGITEVWEIKEDTAYEDTEPDPT